MTEVSTEVIENAVYNLCLQANTVLNADIYNKIKSACEHTSNIQTKNILNSILKNAKTAYDTKRPLCQDTGQVLVFLEIGQNVILKGDFIENAINRAIEKCYKENYFRKSVIENAIFNRINTRTNTPAIIYTKYIQGDEIYINVLVKGGGSENKSSAKMLLPNTSKEEIVSVIGDMILSAGVNACPPMFVGIGLGGTQDKATILSKEVFFYNNFSKSEKELAEQIKNFVNKKATEIYNNNYVLDIKLSSIPTHIACLPVSVTINCHSDRYSTCIVKDNKIIYNHKTPDYTEIQEETTSEKEVNTQDIEAIKSLKQGENILLTGDIYVARDMAHKKLKELYDKNLPLPFDIKDKIIFYAGPCPARPDEVIGSIGPTTSGRMDKYAVEMYNNKGLLATIGKGSRNDEVIEAIKRNNAKYFTVTGGIAALLAEKVKKCEIIAFEELGAEALYKLYVEKFPVYVEIG